MKMKQVVEAFKEAGPFVTALLVMLGVVMAMILWLTLAAAVHAQDIVADPLARPDSPAVMCSSMGELAKEIAQARDTGTDQAAAQRIVDGTDPESDDAATQEARSMATQVIWYVYVADSDRRVKPSKLAYLVTHACLARAAGGQP